jgi:hypothetical protein
MSAKGVTRAIAVGNNRESSLGATAYVILTVNPLGKPGVGR